ncbi:unnamed protein product [Rhizopus stolonifer]
MPLKHRKVPYSGKKKKQQLQEKNAKKTEKKLEKATRDPYSFDYLNKSKPLSTSFLITLFKVLVHLNPTLVINQKMKQKS